MKKLRTQFERFCYKNRDKGIPNLMLYIVLGNAIVWLMTMINGGTVLYDLLYFDKEKILQGQVWRLVTYVFTQSGTSMFELIFLYFFYMLGRHVESSMGIFKFNLYYLCGVLMMDIFAMIFATPFTAPLYVSMAYYLHLSLILTFATLYPDSHFMLLFIIPIKAWIIALIYLLLVAISIFNLSYPVLYFPHNLFPLVALGNYLLFMGSDISNLIPLSWRRKATRKPNKQPKKTGTIPFPNGRDYAPVPPKAKDYNHRCTVCGRTDVSNPELEFRYCSKCQGYHCYCEDHISNHTHIE